MGLISFYQYRKLTNNIVSIITVFFTVMALVPLMAIIVYVFIKGISAINPDFFIRLPSPVGELGGGIGNAILGTITLVLLSCVLGLPIGIFAGIYLSEYGNRHISVLVRLVCDVLNGVPSIVIGLFVYTIIVLPMKSFSALAGAVALAIIMVPTIARTTEELLRMVSHNLREASLALGIPQWKTVLHIVLPTARTGIITGIMLAIARIAGETAPLLFTAFNNQYWQSGLNQPIASMTVQIYTYAISPFDDWHSKAWAGALIIMVVVLGINVLSRIVNKRFYVRD